MPQISDFDPTFRQRLAIKWYLRDEGLLLQCLIGIVYVFKRVMNTPSMIVGPSIILLRPHVGRFHASDFLISANFQAMFGHQVVPQRCRLATAVLDWHCICIQKNDDHSQHDCRVLCHTFTATIVGRFHASDFSISANFQTMFGHQVVPQRCRLATRVLDWHCICV